MVEICGIAGFCISDEYREKISHDQLNMLMRAGISTNLHRGRDAVGFFTGYGLPTPSEDGMCAVWWKDKGSGIDHLDTIEKELRRRPTPNVLGMHTRAASGTFKPEHGSNNHPVLHNDVLAIHNGYIRNHLDIKDSTEIRPDTVYKEEDKPKVDSVAIAMLMDTIPVGKVLDNVEDIAYKLAILAGGWATHIMWKGDPSTTLLVAGPQYPLTVQWAAGRLSYASEENTLRAMWNAAKLPFPKKAHPRVMDEGTFMLINNGAPVSYGKYDVDRKVYTRILKEKNLLHRPGRDDHIRIVPKTNERVTATRYKRRYKDDETENSKLWSSFRATDPGLKLIYTVKDGLIVNDETREIFNVLKPVGNVTVSQLTFKDGAGLMDYPDRPWCDMFAECDQIFAIVRGPRDVDLFGWYGDTEIAISDTCSILNIFDWSNHQEQDRVVWEHDDTWDVRREEALKEYSPLLEELRDGETFRSWFKKNSTEPRKSSNRSVVGTADGGSNHNGHRPNNHNRQPIPLGRGTTSGTGEDNKHLFEVFRSRAGTSHALQFPIITKKESKEWLESMLGADFLGMASIPFVALQDAFEADPFDDVEDVDGEVVYHMDANTNIPFMYNEVCILHDQKLMEHKAPHNCDYLMLASLALHQRVVDLNVLEYLYYGEIKLNIGLTDSSYAAYQMCDHQWIDVQSIALEAYNLWWRIPEMESCVECLATRNVATWPENIVMLKKTFPTFEIEGVVA